MNENIVFGLKPLDPGEVGPDDADVIHRYAGRIDRPISAPKEVEIREAAKLTSDQDEGHPRDKAGHAHHTESAFPPPSPGGPVNPIPPSRWAAFFSSPQGYVITATVAVLLSGAAMYSQLDSKIGANRLETKSDIQSLEQRIDKRFDKVDARFDKIDARFDALMNKVDEDSRETRGLIRDSARTQTPSPAS